MPIYQTMISKKDFMEICKGGDTDIVTSAIRDIESQNNSMAKDKTSKEHWSYWDWGLSGACEYGHLNIVELMITKGANRFDSGLESACIGGNLSVVELMIKMDVLIITLNTGLQNACERGHLDIVKFLIEKGAYRWDMGLESACNGGHLDIVKLMIRHGARNWGNGLAEACRKGHLNVVNFMIGLGASDWNRGLWGACVGRQLNIIKLMLKKGANRWEYLFKYFPVNMIDTDIVKLMIEKGISFESYLKYPRDVVYIFKLHELGLSLDNLKNIDGFDDLIKDIEHRQNIVGNTLSCHIVNDLIGVVNEYVIN